MKRPKPDTGENEYFIRIMHQGTTDGLIIKADSGEKAAEKTFAEFGEDIHLLEVHKI